MATADNAAIIVRCDMKAVVALQQYRSDKGGGKLRRGEAIDNVVVSLAVRKRKKVPDHRQLSGHPLNSVCTNCTYILYQPRYAKSRKLIRALIVWKLISLFSVFVQYHQQEVKKSIKKEYIMKIK